jgi:hypothetical protein
MACGMSSNYRVGANVGEATQRMQECDSNGVVTLDSTLLSILHHLRAGAASLDFSTTTPSRGGGEAC